MNPEVAGQAKQRLEDVLTFFGVNTTVEVTQDGPALHLAVEADVTGRLIGHRGETLRALQHLMNVMTRRDLTERVYVNVDIAGYKKARAERLVTRALELAEQVKDSGEEVVLPPMSPAERRLVHMELAKIAELLTESRGQEPHRRLVIIRRP